MRLGILGGTFNPIHNGHLIIAERCRDEFKLDKVLFIPANIPPHKDYEDDIDVRDRIHLIELAIASNPDFELDTMEIERGGVSYTTDTVNYLLGKYALSDKPYLIIGADLLPDLDTWNRIDELKERVYFSVHDRGDYCALALENGFNKMFPSIRVPKNMVNVEISSTDIRWKLSQGMSIKYLVPDSVEKEIIRKNYYKTVRKTI